ncbi:MAG: DUF4384 domain-containing protein, partial [Dongiaceae bacterium]
PGSDLSKAKIIDFGISKLVDPAVKTIVGTDFAGKYSYVSPEQVGLFGGEVDGRSDIYSLGLVLAAAAIGKPLDMGNSPISVVEARRAVPDLARVPKEMRDELTAMLQPDPADRPQSMRELVPEPPRPATRADPGRTRRTVSDAKAKPTAAARSGRGAAPAIAAVALVLVLAVGGVGYWLFAPGPPDPEPPDPPDPPDKIAELTKGADLALQGFQCAQLSARVSATGDIQVGGYAASPDDKQQVASRLQALPGVGRIDNQIAVMRPPLCDALGLLHSEFSSPPNSPTAPRIDAGGRAGTYFEDESLRIGVTATSAYDGYLYVDYIDGQEGYVVHLLPNEMRPDNAVRAGSSVDIGSLPQEADAYIIRPPFGTNLIVAISTPEPLFPVMRKHVEQGEEARIYLADLRRQLQSLAAGGNRNSLFGSFSVLQLSER